MLLVASSAEFDEVSRERPGVCVDAVREDSGCFLVVDFQWFPSPDEHVMLEKEWKGNTYTLGRIENTGALVIHVRGARIFKHAFGMQGGVRKVLDCNGFGVPLAQRERVIEDAMRTWDAMA